MAKDYNTTMPKDSQGNIIPALSILPAGGQKVAVTATSARTANDFKAGTQVITVYATEDMYLELGDSAVVALNTTSFFLAKGIYYNIVVNDLNELKFTRIAAIRATADGTLYVHERT